MPLAMQMTHPSFLGRDQRTDRAAIIVFFFSLKCLLAVPTKALGTRGGIGAQATLSMLAVCSNVKLQRALF